MKVHGQRERFAAGLTTPPKKKDRKRQKARDGWWQVRQFALGRSEFRCEYPECYLLADHVHHILPRSAGGTDDLGNLAALCWSHHRWVHDNPAKARELGLLRSRYGQTIR